MPGTVASCRLDATAEIIGDGLLETGRDVVVGRGTWISMGAGHRVTIGEGVWIGNDCDINAAPRIAIGARSSLQNRSQVLGDVSIGAGCVCAANLYVSSSWHRFADTPHLPVRVQDFHAQSLAAGQRSRAVHIGDDCWFGINVVVLPGVTIGRGCVIGANSVVCDDLAPYSIAAGSPARVVKTRLEFSPPGTIDAGVDTHIPYFYAGLRQLGPVGADDRECPRVRGGWPTAGAFSLALRTTGSTSVLLALDSICAGQLRHGDAIVDIRPGQQTVSFPPTPGRWDVLEFDWHASAPPVTDALVVLGASAASTTAEGSGR